MTYMNVCYKYLCHKILRNEKKWNICSYIELPSTCTMKHNSAFVRNIFYKKSICNQIRLYLNDYINIFQNV